MLLKTSFMKQRPSSVADLGGGHRGHVPPPPPAKKKGGERRKKSERRRKKKKGREKKKKKKGRGKWAGFSFYFFFFFGGGGGYGNTDPRHHAPRTQSQTLWRGEPLKSCASRFGCDRVLYVDVWPTWRDACDRTHIIEIMNWISIAHVTQNITFGAQPGSYLDLVSGPRSSSSSLTERERLRFKMPKAKASRKVNRLISYLPIYLSCQLTCKKLCQLLCEWSKTMNEPQFK